MHKMLFWIIQGLILRKINTKYGCQKKKKCHPNVKTLLPNSDFNPQECNVEKNN